MVKIRIHASLWASAGDLLTFHQNRAGREPSDFMKDQARVALRAAVRTLNADEILAAGGTRRLGPEIAAALLARGIAVEGLTIGRPLPQVGLNAVVDDLRRNFPASARRLAEALLAADPKVSLYHSAMGMVLDAEGKPDLAEQEFLTAIYLEPSSPEPMSRLYVRYISSGDPQKIMKLERLLVASLAKKSDSPIHNDWLGQVYLRMHKYDQAEMAFRAAIGQAPKDPEFRISLGTLRVEQWKLEEARKAYEEALALRPDYALALFNLGATYAMEGQIDKALDYFHRAERAGPATHALLNSLAQAYEQKEQYDFAVEYLRRSLKLKPNQPDRQAELKRDEQLLKTKRGAKPRPAPVAAPGPPSR